MLDFNIICENVEVNRINKRLLRDHKTIDNKPIFRIVWSESIFENRFGTFNDFTNSGLFIRQVTETRRTKKYNYIKERWILEKWAPGNLTANRETPDAINGDYIPVYVFENGKGEYLPVTEKATLFIVNFTLGKIKQDEIPSEEYLEEKEIQAQVEAMDDHPSYFQTRPGSGRNGIGYTGGLKGK